MTFVAKLTHRNIRTEKFGAARLKSPQVSDLNETHFVRWFQRLCVFTQDLGEMIQFDEHIFFGESFDLIFQARGHLLSIMSFWQRLGNLKMVFPDSSSFVKHHGPILLESYYLSQSNSDESLMKRQSPWSILDKDHR